MSAPAADPAVTRSAHVQRVAVVGGGTMGNGIAQVFATSGFPVRLIVVKPEFVERALAGIGKSLDRVAKKQGWEESRAKDILARISGGTQLEAAKDCQLVVEAVTEDFAVKRQIFTTLDQHAPADAILASNTSSISITEIAAVTKRPEQVIGMHFMNPVPVMQLVELIRGIATDEPTYRAMLGVVERLGKTAASAEDFPAFIVNRLLMPMINEAVYTLYEGVGSVKSIDQSMKLGANHPMGPLELADFIGLDTCLAIMNVLFDG